MVRYVDFRAINITRQARACVDAGWVGRGSRFQNPPMWLKAVERIAPSELLTRTVAVQHRAQNPKARKPKNVYRPQRIVYEEDELRRDFYRDHPWELARPRIILEVDGKDARYLDWSKGLLQPGVPLTGECVVQRQLWLMHNTPGLTKQQAYDMVRREFYALRQEEEVEQRIAQEEAMMVGAYFGKNRLQIGMQLEDAEFERWKKWAGEENVKIENQRSSAYTSYGKESEDTTESAEAEISAVLGVPA